tara:strand:+ start:1008 stop:1253 length:246 start_codon:yes stop_codon:yes gene_type:complete
VLLHQKLIAADSINAQQIHGCPINKKLFQIALQPSYGAKDLSDLLTAAVTHYRMATSKPTSQLLATLGCKTTFNTIITHLA